ncbi:MAG: hypothetical protein IPO21_12905 [Bacteroidales bacterium]|nr:hypothetical protein [Bacteroidales bacterium]
MKKIITILSVAALIFGFASCNKCVTCSYEDELSEEFCEDQFEDKAEYDLTIDFYELLGAECN